MALLRTRGERPHAPTRDELDLLDADGVRRAVADARPEVVFHLAALASVERSWEAPAEVVGRNIEMTLNVLEAVRREAPEAVLLVAGSGEVYGPPERLPLSEDAPLHPQNPYAVSKAACDLLAGQFADACDLRVVRTRAFNHAGPGQHERYVVGTLTRQVAQAERDGVDEALLRVGNLEATRDFTDVRDVVKAYAEAPSLEPGVYNVCSGQPTSVGGLIELLAAAARVPVRHQVDPERLRGACGWRPEIALERTVADVLDWWRRNLP